MIAAARTNGSHGAAGFSESLTRARRASGWFWAKAEKVRASLAAKHAGADFVKTSTGFSKGGATVEDIALMRKTVGADLGVKASGGVKSLEDARQMIAAGATRIGASVGVKIAQEAGGVKTSVIAGGY